MTVSSMWEPAVGAMALHLILYLAPPIATVFLRPTKPSLDEKAKQSKLYKAREMTHSMMFFY